jgi:hypothetical protein
VVGDVFGGDHITAPHDEFPEKEDESAAVIQGGVWLSLHLRTISLRLHDRLLALLTSAIGRGSTGVYKDP